MNRRGVKWTIVTMLTIITLVPTAGWAFGGLKERERPQGPPPEAIEACKGKAAGDKVQLTTPSGEVLQAVCKNLDDQLVAMPVAGRHRDPPPEAFEVCENKEAGNTVQLTTPSGETITATCREKDGQLVAVPAGGKGRNGRQGGPPDGR